jgi:hypothetical protein
MDALNRLRETIEDTHDGTKPLNDETYRTMMEDLRKVFQAIPQQHQPPPPQMVAHNPQQHRFVVDIRSDAWGDDISMPLADYNRQMAEIIAQTGAYVWGSRVVPAVWEFLQRLNNAPATLEQSFLEHDARNLRYLITDVFPENIVNHSHELKTEFLEKYNKTIISRKYIVTRHYEARVVLNRMLEKVAVYRRTNPEELNDPKHLPMLMAFAIGINPNTKGCILQFDQTMEGGRKDFVANLKTNDTSRLHKLAITLKGMNGAEYKFEAYTPFVKMGSCNGITQILYSMLMYMDWINNIVNTKMIYFQAKDCSYRYDAPVLSVSGITARTKDKKRHYKDINEWFTITYISKLNNGDD